MLTDYWCNEANKIVDKYKKSMIKNNVSAVDIQIVIKQCYNIKNYKQKDKYDTMSKIYMSLHEEIDKFPKFYRGIIYRKLHLNKVYC